MKNRRDGKTFSIMDLVILLALTAEMKLDGIIRQATDRSLISKTTNGRTAQSVGNGYMHGKVG